MAPNLQMAINRMANQPILIVDYDPGWPAKFQAEREAVLGVMGRRALAIEHFGSTAVPGLAAKPIIDILVAVRDLAVADLVAPRLAGLGYKERAIPESDRRFFERHVNGVRTHHLHLAVINSTAWTRPLAFREHLRRDPKTACDYAQVKRTVAEIHAFDREAYTRAKGPFIDSVMASILGETISP